LFGAGDYSMRVWLDPQKIAARGMTPGDVVRAIREQNLQVAAGSVGAPPFAGNGMGSDFQLSVNAQGRLTTEEEFGEIVIKTQAPRDAAGDLRDFERVREAGAVVIALVGDEHLRLTLKPAESAGVNDPVTIALIRCAGLAFGFRVKAAAGTRRIGGKRGARRALESWRRRLCRLRTAGRSAGCLPFGHELPSPRRQNWTIYGGRTLEKPL